MRVHLSALGCRLNEAELEHWANAFSVAGDVVAATPATADILVLNTCAVTAEAVRKSRQRLQRLQRDNPRAKVVLSGCYSALESPAVLAELGVDLVLSNEQKDQLVPLTRAAFAQPGMPAAATVPGESALFARNRHRSFLKIQDGCRYRCTYCIVTVARGDERSRPLADLVREVDALAANGVQEVVLTGVHVGGYGSDLGTDLYTLVSTLLRDTDMPRLRFASVEPWDLPEPFVHLFDNPRLMPHMHLPLQSGCDTVLRRMARRCKTAEFRALVEHLQSSVPGFNITTDLIVGFPGESEHEWRTTLDYLRSLPFGHMHVFSYSRREGTRAASLPDPVPRHLRQARSRAAHELAAQQRASVLAAQVGRTVPVLWEAGVPVAPEATTPEATTGRHYTGYTPNYLKVSIISDRDLSNRIEQTQLTGVHAGVRESHLCGALVAP